jgi:hypothetical protein
LWIPILKRFIPGSFERLMASYVLFIPIVGMLIQRFLGTYLERHCWQKAK